MRRTAGSVVSKNIIVLHFSTFSLFSKFLVLNLSARELQSADFVLLIAMAIMARLLTMMMKHKRKSLPQICCSIIESSGADGSEAIQCSLVPWCTLPCYSGALDSGALVYQMGPKGWQRLSPPSPCTTLHQTSNPTMHKCSNTNTLLSTLVT